MKDTTVELYLCDPEGIRLDCLDYVTEYEYVLAANGVNTARVRLPSTFDRSKIRLDDILEIWRGSGPGTLKCDFWGFLRAWAFGDINGMEYTELIFRADLLERRVVEDYAGSAQAEMTDQADDMIKAIATDQLGADTDADRDLTSVGGGFTVSAALADGVSITKAFAYANVLAIAQELAGISTQQGTSVYFDVVPVSPSSVTGKLAFRLDTYTGQRGMDRTADSDNPAFVGPAWGNLNNGRVEYDYQYEINFVYVLGQGEGEVREVVEVSDTDRIEASIWNRREGIKDARNIEYGDADALTAEGYAALNLNKPKFRFSGDIIETDAFRYGIDWSFGDLVSVVYGDYETDAMIDKVYIVRTPDGQETISATLEVSS